MGNDTQKDMEKASSLADEKQIKEIEDISTDKLITCPVLLSPMTYARKVIAGKIVDYLSKSKVYDSDEYSCLLVAVYILSVKDSLRLMKESRNPKALFEKAVRFADNPKVDYEALMLEAQGMLATLDTVESLISDDRDGEEEDEVTKK
jgi:hypothetical protein